MPKPRVAQFCFPEQGQCPLTAQTRRLYVFSRYRRRIYDAGFADLGEGQGTTLTYHRLRSACALFGLLAIPAEANQIEA
jgi:hypothetical protein